MSPFWKTAQQKLITFWSLLFTLFIACIYIALSAWLLNYRFVWDTLVSSSPLSYKFIIFRDLLLGIFPSLGTIDTSFLLITSVLVGINVILITRSIQSLHGLGKTKLTVGGATLISLVTVGCGACGFTIFSLFGLSASLSFLPFHGLEIHVLTIALLLFSSWYMTKKLLQAKVCSLI